MNWDMRSECQHLSNIVLMWPGSHAVMAGCEKLMDF
jgi:hypothetical protein